MQTHLEQENITEKSNVHGIPTNEIMALNLKKKKTAEE